MKYGSTTTAGTSNNVNLSNNVYDNNNSVINNGQQTTMMFLPVEATNSGVQQSSVIKTAPPGRSSAQMLMDFSPKQEPIELAPLSNTHPCLQNLGKMSVGTTQLEHYYSSMNNSINNNNNNSSKTSYSPYYEYLNVGSNNSSNNNTSYPQQTTLGGGNGNINSNNNNNSSGNGNGNGGVEQQHQDWPYMSYGNLHHHHNQQQQQIHLHQQQQLNYLNQLDNCEQQQQQQQRILIYKNNNIDELIGGGGNGISILSSVDSGIGQELLIEQAKQHLHEFFGPVSLSSTGVLIPSQQQQQHSSVIHQHHINNNNNNNDHNNSSILLQQNQRQREHRSSADSNHSSTTQLQRIHDSREQSIPVCIPKLDNQLGFQYTLEAPISTSIRKEDDRMTYVNKGQFYTISFDYILDLRCPIKGMNVRSQIIIVFREDKSFEEELKTWLVWYKRQHSPKQRIIEIDTKNSIGAIGGNYEEIAHNAIQFNWIPGEQPGPKVSIAVQCLSTDFSTQKGVKGLPLHVQIDTYDDQSDSKIPFHRGYCQIKVFCDKGANRKMLHENRRDERRRIGSSAPVLNNNNNGRKKIDSGEFHESCERSQFYHSADLERPAALFIPNDDFFFDNSSICSYDALSEMEPLPKRPKPSERIIIYVRKADEDVFTPLHLVPPSLGGLARAISEKYNLDETKIEAFYKQCQKGGITVKIDDDMLRHYSNQDTFLIELKQSELDRHTFYAVTLIELLTVNNDIPSNNNNKKLINSFIHHNHQDNASATSSSSTASENPSTTQQRATATVW